MIDNFAGKTAVLTGAGSGFGLECARIGVGVVGLEVPHCHIHLIPLHNSVGEMNFGGEKLSPSQEELLAMAQKIKSNFV